MESQEQQRQRYNVVSIVDRQRIINAHLNGKNRNGFGNSAASDQGHCDKLRQNWACGATTKGWSKKKIDNEMINLSFEAKSTITLKELNQQMRVHLEDKPHTTEQAISKLLDSMLFSLKNVHAMLFQWNTA